MKNSDLFLAVIEDQKGSYTHMELNELSNKYEVVHNFKLPWPFHYGYLKETFVESDGDPLDLAVFGDFRSETGLELYVRVIGAAVIKDGDHKIFAVNPLDEQFGECVEYSEIPLELRKKGENIFARGGHQIEEILTSSAAVGFIKTYQRGALTKENWH
jgi:inorganic pyrophosphatase